MIGLAGAELLGSGNGRDCFVHPGDPGLVVKVPRVGGDPRRQNQVERTYCGSLIARGAPFVHLPAFHGEAATDRGPALVYERIRDADGGPARPLAVRIAAGEIVPAAARQLLDAMRLHLLRHWIVLADAGAGNLLCVRGVDGWRLVFADGIGARRPGVRLWLYCRSRWMARYKTRRQWPKLLENLSQEAGTAL